jgi:methylthioxylose transferase
VTTDEPESAHRSERRDLLGWALLVAAGLLFTWLAIRGGARLGTAGAPFLGAYRLRLGPGTALAPAVAAAGLALAARGWSAMRRCWPGRWRWPSPTERPV